MDEEGKEKRIGRLNSVGRSGRKRRVMMGRE